jgi:hypothetical protein
MIKRSKCVVCEGLQFDNVISFQRFPTYMGVDCADQTTSCEPMSWVECEKCGCIQLSHLVEPEVLYSRQHNSAVGKSWHNHHKSLADLVCLSLNTNDSVLDVGGANLRLANFVCDARPDVIYTVIDMSCGKYGDLQKSPGIIEVAEDFMQTGLDCTYDCIVHSHTLEHAYEPIEMLRKMSLLLKDTGKMIMSIPNIDRQVRDRHLNALHYEHTYYYNDELLSIVLAKSGFEIDSIIEHTPWNNFYVCKKKRAQQHPPQDISRQTNLRSRFLGLFEEIQRSMVQIDSKYDAYYCFGAHIFTQYLLHLGLDSKKIVCILDNDESKQGKVLASTKIPTSDLSVLCDVKDPVVVVRAAQFTREITEQILEINPSAKIV